jgi:cytochrome c-type biogenesis protein CcmE
MAMVAIAISLVKYGVASTLRYTIVPSRIFTMLSGNYHSVYESGIVAK